MISNQRIELLAPAGSFEKLEIAIHYGADAVYLGGKDFSLRNFARNFESEEMARAVAYAHARGVRVYVACNVYSKNAEQEAITEFLRSLNEIGPDAVIVSEPGIAAEALRLIPDIPIHLGTQANTTNYRSVLFWEKLGVKRINLARELSLKEIREIADRCSVELEAFVHGAMCVSHSGQCLLSAFMANREANRGLCCHPCRFRYAVMEETRPGEYFPVAEDDRGAYVFNSKDLCMIGHIPEMIASGICSLKIEGRMKGIHYLATVVKAYRDAIDAYYSSAKTDSAKKSWAEELEKVNPRGYCTGFYFGNPGNRALNDEGPRYPESHFFIGKILEKQGNRKYLVETRNKVISGGDIEILPKNGPIRHDRIIEITDEFGIPKTAANPNEHVIIEINADCSKNDLVRGVKSHK